MNELKLIMSALDRIPQQNWQTCYQSNRQKQAFAPF